MNVNDVFQRVKDSFGDEAAVQITEAKVVRWINDAQREAVMQHEGLLTTDGFIDVVADTQVYALPEDLFTLSHVYYMADDTYYKLRYLSTAEMNEYVDGWSGEDYGTGTPLVFTKGSNNREIALFPVPDTSKTSGIKVTYSRHATDVSTRNSEIDLPSYYHSYIEHFCMMKAYEMDEDWEASDRKAQIIQGTLDFNNNRESWFGRDTYPAVIPSWEDM